MPTPYPKEQMHRIKYTKLTPEQIAGKALRLVLERATFRPSS